MSLDLVGTQGRNLANLVNLNQPIGGSGPLPYPDFGFIEWREQNATSSYKGMDLDLQRRFTKGWGFSLAYTLSECTDQSAEHLSTGGSPSFSQDARDLEAWEGPCGFDTRHRFVGSFVVQLPFAKDSHGLTKALLGDWTRLRHLRLPHRPALHRHPGQQQRGPGAHRAAEPRRAAARARRRWTSGSSPPTSRR